jgi:hypothetical protein
VSNREEFEIYPKALNLATPLPIGNPARQWRKYYSMPDLFGTGNP